jgi:hypothetical protein
LVTHTERIKTEARIMEHKEETVGQVLKDMGYNVINKNKYIPGKQIYPNGKDNPPVWQNGEWVADESKFTIEGANGYAHELSMVAVNKDRVVLYKLKLDFCVFIAFTSKANHTKLMTYRLDLKKPYYVGESKIERLEGNNFDFAIQFCKDHAYINIIEEYETDEYLALKLLK